MLPASNSGLSAHGDPRRPSSSLSLRPPSSASQRPVSSLSRPISRTSTRPQSRVSLRPNSRHARSKIIPLCQRLVTQLTGLQERTDESDDYKTAVDFTVKNLEATTMNKAAAGVDMAVMDRQINGHALKARINSQESLGEALQVAYESLKKNLAKEHDLDQEIKISRLPDHLQLLIKLSQPPTPATLAHAEVYLHDLKHPPASPKTLTWADILAEEPFEGEHWEGVYGMPPGSIRYTEGHKRWDAASGGSTPSLSPLGSDDLELDVDDSISSSAYTDTHDENLPSPRLDNQSGKQNIPPLTYAHRKAFEDLQAKQYWRPEWRGDADPNRPFDIGDSSTLGPAFTRALRTEANGYLTDGFQQEKYINEHDAVREVLMALQGRDNIIFVWMNMAFAISKSAPRLIHLSLSAQASILASLGNTATILQHLRRFTSLIFSQSQSHTGKGGEGSNNAYKRSSHSQISRTLEAFADAAGIGDGKLIVSLLDTEKSLRDTFEDSFSVLLAVVTHVFPPKAGAGGWEITSPRSPAVVSASLLDTLFASVQVHLERGDQVTADTLMHTGQSKELDDEFFIEDIGLRLGAVGVGLLDPDFWTEGYALRDGVAASDIGFEVMESQRAIPKFLEHVADMILGSGKAVGLLRALGATALLDEAIPVKEWLSFANLLASIGNSGGGVPDGQTGSLFSVSVDTLSRLIYDGLLPQCEAVGELVVKVLVDECDLWEHLSTIEDLFLMRKGDSMSHFIDIVFAKMDSQQSWGDFHFLNTAFNDVVKASTNVGEQEWVRPSLVRFSYRGGKDKDRTIARTVKAADGLQVEYTVPFPLSYIFPPQAVLVYGEIFVFLLQIRRANSVLGRILVRGERLRGELKVFYAMRSRMCWFINTLLNFLTTYVIHSQVIKFHMAFKAAKSLDEMIRLHNEQSVMHFPAHTPI
ncbi:Spc98 family-domain-containing protein [Infundibulicybe gibba]|nr:Spc98 family-domain-containing protein [Infundibulicybe gibba]